ncbi:formate/nitrite transporter family protein [Bifidobacterium sp. SMB2]|uniref:Formate/nitrite transporter family protein n=1 Tax=Bifidobacterium saimiriisciurei TaxID=2661627 RepID=A0ABX0CC28_9BIFI|nr:MULTISPECIES: formate/nitrite transporter family protein [Bifidobacterium]NEG95949.1 formate/nitrite transporter family protein [Bifidobacterium sp. SMB2]NEH11796.1 formate/nitrite transporter family protein [Bifidobacterium saimiriisciurei]
MSSNPEQTTASTPNVAAPTSAPEAATAAAAAAATAAAAAASAAATAADAANSAANTAATATAAPAAAAPASPLGAAPKLHPLFPGNIFVSTVLDVLNSKETMTGRLVSKYMQRALMAGLFVGIFFTAFFAISATFAAAGPAMALAGKVLGACTFGWALVLIYYTNSELLTSNMMIVSIGVYHKRISWLHSLRILGLCLVGNLLGGLVVAALMRFSTIISGDIYTVMVAAVATKTGYLTQGAFGIADLFVRAIFCNFCINIAMLMCYNGKIVNDFTKCIIMMVAVFVFAYLGFEHSVADSVLFLIMGLHGVGDPLMEVLAIIVVILGNFVGGGLLIGINFAVMNDQHTHHAERNLRHNIGRR